MKVKKVVAVTKMRNIPSCCSECDLSEYNSIKIPGGIFEDHCRCPILNEFITDYESDRIRMQGCPLKVIGYEK